MRRFMRLGGVALQVLLCENALAANSVQVESKLVAPGDTAVTAGIRLTNDMPLRLFVLPLEIRAVTPGAFITSMKMSFGGRLDSSLTDGSITNQFGTKTLACGGPVPGFGDLLYTTANEEHPVNGSPEGALFARFNIQSRALAPGTDVIPSMLLTLDIGQTTGTFEIDTTCTLTSNHLYFIKDTQWPYVAVVPAFAKGIITIASCDCAHHADLNGDSVIDVFDVSSLMDYLFSGGPAPVKDPNCPHVDRGDVDCSGEDDVFDVVYLIDYVFSGGPAPCNPCACSPYPANCP